MNIEKPSFKKICLMHLQALTNFPYIEKDFDALTDYELLSKVVDYLNQVINNTNEQNTVVENLYNAFVELKDYVDNYFDTLDVQDEVNNKLDEMAKDGTLDQIIEQYLNSSAIWGFDTVADMKEATNLIDGSYARTLGYHSKNDGGGAEYKIRTKTNADVVDEMFIIALADNTLIAEYIIENNEVNVNQFGAYGDGTHNDTTVIQAVLTHYKDYVYQPIIKLLNKVYLITNLTIYPKNKLIGAGYEHTKLLANDETTGSIITISEDAWHYCEIKDLSISCKTSNNSVENAILIDVDDSNYDSYSTFENILIKYIPNGNGIWNKKGGRECRFNNIFIKECGGYGLIAGSSDSLYYNISSNHNKKAGIWNSGSNNRFINNKCYLNGENNTSENRYERCGFYCTGIISTFTSCDAQENYCDGFYVANDTNSFINCKADANGISVETGNDANLLYSGFYVSTSYTGRSIKNCQFVIECDDFRRAQGKQAQKYGIDIKYLTNSNIIISSKNQVQDIFYDTGYAINNSNFANNFIVLNGNYFGNLISNRLTLQDLSTFKQQLDFISGTECYRVYLNTNKLQLDYRKNNVYKNAPVYIQGGDNNNGTIETDATYTLNLNARGIGFFGNTPYARQTAPNNASDLSSCITSVNSLIDILKNYGLIN